MTLTPELLRSVAAARLRDTHPELSAHVDSSTPQALRELVPRGETVVVTVIGRFSLPDWVRETCRFALSVPVERRAPWRRSFTRTVHLSGRPDNLRGRFAFDHVAADGSAAWLGPAPDAGTATLRRLLKTFRGGRELGAWSPVTVEVPGDAARPPVHRDLYVATANVTVARTLVQVNHLLVESVMDGLIGPGDRLTLRAVPRLTGLAAPLAALRVDADTHRPHELQAYAALTEEA
ncbi:MULTISPECIES: DUF6182 family protein [Saccharothrix]|uniref:DUF6182 family protein n=1 Tax=Saccharothrix TaxID=2071 RepID=UPI0009390F68|nr:DUF6182 family protein [Saccharothrix sp. CB00851]OKI36423.1 hypothetical protein A6A25_22045 [Saccharothrix sp. CB00851]